MPIDRKEKIPCKLCGKLIARGNMATHKKHGYCKRHRDDKTTGKNSVTITSPAAGQVFPAAPVESKKLIEINLKGEYDKMTEILNPKKKESGREKKYKCAACDATFDNLIEGKCPDCGVQLL